jgi:hypothetical protein
MVARIGADPIQSGLKDQVPAESNAPRSDIGTEWSE